MTASLTTIEREALNEVERRLSSRGYVVRREPTAEELPDFLGQFRADAIATGRTPNLLIELTGGEGSRKVETAKAEGLHQLLDGHPDWKLEVVYLRPSAPLLETAPIAAIRDRLLDVRRLADADRPAALVVGWSLLEAVARILAPDRAERALTPATTVELSATLGTSHPLRPKPSARRAGCGISSPMATSCGA